MFSKVSLFFNNLLFFAGEKTKIGGEIENTLKNEKGAKFFLPNLSIVLTNAIGLGVTEEERYL